MTNLINTLSERLEKRLKYYNVTEVFIVHGEVCVTSEYELDESLYLAIEKEVL